MIADEEQMVKCSTTVDCLASSTVMTARECCVNSEDGLSYSIRGQQRCHACKGINNNYVVCPTRHVYIILYIQGVYHNNYMS